MPGFLTDDELSARLEIILKPAPDQPRPDWWGVTVTDANQAAYNEILSRLANRGLSPTQIAAWNRGREFQIDIGLYYCGLKGSVLEEYDAAQLPALNRGPEIDRKDGSGNFVMFLTTADGTPLVPQTRSVVGHGRMKTTGETFRDELGNWRRW